MCSRSERVPIRYLSLRLYRVSQLSSRRKRTSAVPVKCQKADILLRRCRLPQGRVELVEHPIYLVAGNHQRGTDTDGVVVGVLT